MCKVISVDVETSIKNKGNPHTKENFLVSVGVGPKDNIQFHYYKDDNFLVGLQSVIDSADVICGVNLKFDAQWLKKHNIKIPRSKVIWDCSIAEYCMSGQKSVLPSMDKLCALYGLEDKQGGLEEYWDAGVSTEFIPYEEVKHYQVGDISRALQIYEAQQNDTRLHKTPNLVKLIHTSGRDSLVLADMEYNGLLYDTKGSLDKAEELVAEQKEILEELYTFAGTKEINFNSGEHLSAFLFGGWWETDNIEIENRIYKTGPRKGESYTRNRTIGVTRHNQYGFFNPILGTELAKSTPERPLYSTSDDVLVRLKCKTRVQRRIIELLKRLATIDKLVGTYLLKLPELLSTMDWGNVIHGQYNQTIAATGRLSSAKPNMQNNPEDADEMFITRF